MARTSSRGTDPPRLWISPRTPSIIRGPSLVGAHWNSHFVAKLRELLLGRRVNRRPPALCASPRGGRDVPAAASTSGCGHQIATVPVPDSLSSFESSSSGDFQAASSLVPEIAQNELASTAT